MKTYFITKMSGLGFVFQILCICCCIAQTRESDKFYQKGIDYVEVGQYKEAIEAFKKCKQIDGNTISQDFNISNNSHEWLGFCYFKINDVDNAKQLSYFYKYKPYNRLEFHGIDTLYYNAVISSEEGKYDRALDYLNQVEDILALTLGKNNIYLNKIWEQQAYMHFGLNHHMAATNILTKIWKTYNDSIGPCYEWQKIGQKLIGCYSAERERDKAIQAEKLDSNTFIIRRTKTFETGLIFQKDSITPILLLPMEYRDIKKINDRFIFVTTDIDHHFIIDFSNWSFSKNITESDFIKYITDVNGVPVFSTFKGFIDFTGKTIENKQSFYVGIEGDKIKFELDSVFYTIPKDSIMQSNNRVKYIFPSKALNDIYGNLFVNHIYNNEYIVVYDKTECEVGLLKKTKSGIIQLLSCDYNEIIPAFDDHHFILKDGQYCYIFDSEKIDKIKISTLIDRISNDFTFDYLGRKYLLCKDYRNLLIDSEGNVYHLPIGMGISESNGICFFVNDDFEIKIPFDKFPLGHYCEFRFYDVDSCKYVSNWRISMNMDMPIGDSKLSNNIRYWMSEKIDGLNYTFVPDSLYSPQRMYEHYAHQLMNTSINEGQALKEEGYFQGYSVFNEDDRDRAHLEDYDAYRIWEDSNYVTYASGYAWDGGGPHGSSSSMLTTFWKKTGKQLTALDVLKLNNKEKLFGIISDNIVKTIIKKQYRDKNDALRYIKYNNNSDNENWLLGDIALTPHGIAFHYNDGSYMGDVNIIVPYSEIGDEMIIMPMSSEAQNVYLESLTKAYSHNSYSTINLQKMDSPSIQKCKSIGQQYGKASGEYLNYLIQLANYMYDKETSLAANGVIQYITTVKDLVGDESSAYIHGTILLIKCLTKNRLYEKAIEECMKLKSIYDRKYMLKSSDYDYAALYLQLAMLYRMTNNIDSAFINLEKSIQYESYPNEDVIRDASKYAYNCKQYTKSLYYAKNILANGRYENDIPINWIDKIIRNFREATSNYRIELRNKLIPWYQNFLPDLAYKTNDSMIVKSAYNAQLLSKNLLLNTEQSLRSAILSSQDTTLINTYLMVQLLKKDLVNIINDKKLKKEEKEERASSVRDEINDLERKLIEKSKLYGDYTKKLRIDIEQVSKYLRQGEMAIEFAVSSDSVYYALIIKGNKSIPQIIKLCTASELITKKKDLFNTIWKPIIPYSDDVKTIYFSPAGELYNLPIEYANSTNNQNIDEKYEIYRLSSTREIVISRDSTYTIQNNANNAVLYGYLDYYADENYKSNIGLDLDKKVFGNNITTRFSKKGRGLRANVGRLDYSKDEIHEIDSLIVSNNYAVVDSIYENSKGTETSLKNYSQKQIRILHLATHGFYISKKEMDNFKDLDFLSLDNVNTDEIEDKELVRSGLLFAGANHTLEGDGVIPDGYDDGILTALEVASLDLIGLDLVVLSACQTGQGDLGDDGVLGLQRGFKKAGANSILMSLWKIEDEATQILMTQFYKNLVSGRSKRQSLQSAQRYLREYNAGIYDRPEYWAAFILLDGIERNN